MWHPDRLPPRLLAWTAGVCLGCLAVAQPARCQFNGDPFDPYRAAYRSSSSPVETQIVPGQGRRVTPPGLGTVPGIGTPWDLNYTNPRLGASRYGEFGTSDRLGLDIYDPINDVYRQLDTEFGRVYRPNAGVDDQYYESQQQRQQLYVEAMREPDPQRRAELLRRYQDLSRRASLGLSPSASRGALNSTLR